MDRAEFIQEMLQGVRELAAECMAMDARTYEEFKIEFLEECDVRARPFMCKVLSVIDRRRALGCY